MSVLPKTLSLTIILLAFSCNSKKTIVDKVPENQQKEMTEAGFKKANVLYSAKEGDCPYTLKIDGESYLFDPINLEETYKKPNLEVWVKYRSLRIPNRCDKASPVEITEIKKV